ncbi:putative ATP-grasp-modified RiPP [Micromonospora sp. WMMA1363]|uniref:putative ATP-grasp-modified RiPP n=1 Tax=Micromonospora sp. WMMA1363 TaxID=3053985 RepID=UPI00259CA200|nr:putative ATP-grasp-modified RiPP [Micromonospora sp. WMMA1363]MDM4721426.1 putative ATP-grasp-modified RiPP [Micromonospora sp. WMMA1363]
MSTFAPDRCLLPLYDATTEQGRATAARPFGLSLSARVGDGMPSVDLTGAYLDPVTQTVVGLDGAVVANKPQTTQKVTTNSKTSYDHQNFNDSTTDTYQD